MTEQQLSTLQDALNQIQNLMQAEQAQGLQVGGDDGIPSAQASIEPRLRQPTKKSLENAQHAIADALKSFH